MTEQGLCDVNECPWVLQNIGGGERAVRAGQVTRLEPGMWQLGLASVCMPPLWHCRRKVTWRRCDTLIFSLPNQKSMSASFKKFG